MAAETHDFSERKALNILLDRLPAEGGVGGTMELTQDGEPVGASNPLQVAMDHAVERLRLTMVESTQTTEAHGEMLASIKAALESSSEVAAEHSAESHQALQAIREAIGADTQARAAHLQVLTELVGALRSTSDATQQAVQGVRAAVEATTAVVQGVKSDLSAQSTANLAALESVRSAVVATATPSGRSVTFHAGSSAAGPGAVVTLAPGEAEITIRASGTSGVANPECRLAADGSWRAMSTQDVSSASGALLAITIGSGGAVLYARIPPGMDAVRCRVAAPTLGSVSQFSAVGFLR